MEIVVDARVVSIEDGDGLGGEVGVTTKNGEKYTFDLLIGADGLKSVVRNHLFPDGPGPRAPGTNAAYRAVISFKELFEKITEAPGQLRNDIHVWGSDDGYIISYPISGGQELNMVISHHRDKPVEDVEETDMEELRASCTEYPPLVKKIVDIFPETKRWPLMITELPRWSNETGNVVLMGDAAHSMMNHAAQGAATSMEDGAFLGTVTGEVVRGTITLKEAVLLYEQTRMPRAWTKQQLSYCTGALTMYAGARSDERVQSSKIEVETLMENPTDPRPRPPAYRSWILWANPDSMQHLTSYDAEGDADFAVCRFLQEKGQRSEKTGMSKGLEEKWWGYVRPGLFDQLPSEETNGVDGNGTVEEDHGMWRWAATKKA